LSTRRTNPVLETFNLKLKLQFRVELMTVIMAADQTEVDPSGRVTEKSKPPRKILVTNWELLLKDSTTPELKP
jgi:hypothetical protein